MDIDSRSTGQPNGLSPNFMSSNDYVNRRNRCLRLAAARELGRHTKAEWELLVILCNRRCARCGIHASRLYGNALSKDHVVPIRYEGSSDAIENIQPMCRNCNSAKGPECVDHVPRQTRLDFELLRVGI